MLRANWQKRLSNDSELAKRVPPAPLSRKSAPKAARRSHGAKPLADTPARGDGRDVETLEVLALLDEEVNRLPARYRLPVIGCYLEGKTNAEVARELGCPAGTVFSRLARARERGWADVEPYGRFFTVRHLWLAGGEEHLLQAAQCLTDLEYLQGTLGDEPAV